MASGDANVKWCIAIVVGLGLLLMVILLPLSFSYVEYHEYGLERHRTTGEVSTDKVYVGGRHHLGPAHTFLKYQRRGHLVTLEDLAVFTSDRAEFDIDVSFQYFLKREQLGDLHRSFQSAYTVQVEAAATAAIKNVATQFSVQQYLKERALVEDVLSLAVNAAVSGVCDPRLLATLTNDTFDPACDNLGVFADVKYFQLLNMDLDKSGIQDRLLEAAILAEQNQTAAFLSQAAVIREQSQVDVQRIRDEANEITQAANAQASFIRERATATAQAVVDGARNSGLTTVFNAVNITGAKQKASLDYIRTVLRHRTAKLKVNFDTLVAN